MAHNYMVDETRLKKTTEWTDTYIGLLSFCYVPLLILFCFILSEKYLKGKGSTRLLPCR